MFNEEKLKNWSYSTIKWQNFLKARILATSNILFIDNKCKYFIKGWYCQQIRRYFNWTITQNRRVQCFSRRPGILCPRTARRSQTSWHSQKFIVIHVGCYILLRHLSWVEDGGAVQVWQGKESNFSYKVT